MKINEIVIVDNQKMRVLDIYADYLGVISIDKNVLPILVNIGEIESFEENVTTLSKSKPIELLSNKEKEKYLKNIKLIQTIEAKLVGVVLYDRTTRNRLFDSLAIEFDMSKTQLKYIFIKYLQYGRAITSMIPAYPSTRNVVSESKRGRHGKSNGFVVDAYAKENFESAIRKYYLTRELQSFKYAYEKLIQDYYTEENTLDGPTDKVKLSSAYPTYHQFRYYYLKRYSNSQNVVYKRYGAIVNKESNRILKSNVEVDKNFLSIELDSTIADFYIVFNTNNSSIIVGRPVIYVISEVISRRIFIYVTLENFMAEASAINALYYFMSGQEEYYKLYDIEINESEFVSFIPTSLNIDRGEFKRIDALSDICAHYNIRNNIMPAYRGSLKPIVERSIGIVNTELKKHIEGVILKDKRHNPRTQQDYRLKSYMTLKDIVQICYRIMKQHNEKEPVQGFNDIDYNGTYSPNSIFEYMQSRLGVGIRKAEKNEAMNLLMPKAKASVTVHGVKFKGLFYISKKIMELGWLEKSKIRGNFQVTIRYNSVSVDCIYAYLYESNIWIELSLTDRSSMFAGKSFMETDEFFNEKNDNISQQQHVALEARVNMYNEINEIKKTAKMKKKNSEMTESNRHKLKSIKDNRKIALIEEHRLFRKSSNNESVTQIETVEIKVESLKNKTLLNLCKKAVEEND